MSRTAKTLMAAAIVLASSSWLEVAHSAAVSPDQTQSITVKFADLDLNQSEDAGVLYHRIERAAELACGDRERTGSLFASRGWQNCVKLAIEHAVAQLDRPALNAYHRQYAADSARKG
jgi:UrcA family protein